MTKYIRKTSLIAGGCLYIFLCNSTLNATDGYKMYYDAAAQLLKENDFSSAEILISKAINKYKKRPLLYYFRAKLRQERLDNCLGAIIDYTKVIKLDYKSYPKAFWRRGRCFYKLRRYKQAVQDYSNCLRILPKYGKVHFLRASAYARIGLLNKAAIDLENAVKYSPEYRTQAKYLWDKIMKGDTDY